MRLAKTAQAVLGVSLGMALSDTSYASEETPTTVMDELRCGAVKVTAESKCIHFTELETQCIEQSFKLSTSSNKQGARLLTHEGKAVRKSFVKEVKVLDAFVTSWACVKSDTGQEYVLLGYTCSWGDEVGECAGGTKEWVRLFTLEGKALSSSVKRQGKRYEALFQKLGIAKLMEEGLEARSLQR